MYAGSLKMPLPCRKVLASARGASAVRRRRWRELALDSSALCGDVLECRWRLWLARLGPRRAQRQLALSKRGLLAHGGAQERSA